MKLYPFDKLWELANAVKSGGNSLYYHPCCDVWTSRGSAAKRASYSRHLKWGRLLLNLDKNIEDKKLALLGKMTEEGWRLPAVLNNSCDPQQRSTTQIQNAFRPHIPDLPQQDFQPSIASGITSCLALKLQISKTRVTSTFISVSHVINLDLDIDNKMAFMRQELEMIMAKFIKMDIAEAVTLTSNKPPSPAVVSPELVGELIQQATKTQREIDRVNNQLGMYSSCRRTYYHGFDFA